MFHRRAGFQPAHQPHPPDAGATQVRLFSIDIQRWLHLQSHRHVRTRADIHRAVESRRRYSNHSERNVVDIDLFADNRTVTTETFLPVAMTQYRDGSHTGFVVFIGQHPAQKRLHSEAGEITSRDDLSRRELGASVSVYI